MPEREIKRRGGAVRYRRKKVKGGYINIAVVRKPGKRGGRTVAGPLHEYRKSKRRHRVG
jgi:hypothetical protein